MVDCVADIELWCRSHGLKLNADKSDVIWLGTRQRLAMINQADRDIHLPSGILQSSETARNLGVLIDQQMTFDAPALAYLRSCFYHLSHIRQIMWFKSQHLRTGCRINHPHQKWVSTAIENRCSVSGPNSSL